MVWDLTTSGIVRVTATKRECNEVESGQKTIGGGQVGAARFVICSRPEFEDAKLWDSRVRTSDFFSSRSTRLI